MEAASCSDHRLTVLCTWISWCACLGSRPDASSSIGAICRVQTETEPRPPESPLTFFLYDGPSSSYSGYTLEEAKLFWLPKAKEMNGPEFEADLHQPMDKQAPVWEAVQCENFKLVCWLICYGVLALFYVSTWAWMQPWLDPTTRALMPAMGTHTIAQASKAAATAVCMGFVLSAISHFDPLTADPLPPSAAQSYQALEKNDNFWELRFLRVANLIALLTISSHLLRRLWL